MINLDYITLPQSFQTFKKYLLTHIYKTLKIYENRDTQRVLYLLSTYLKHF